MWVLNNEGEDMMYWSGGPMQNIEESYKQYTTFYIDTIIPIMRDSGIIIESNFMDTSPSNGV